MHKKSNNATNKRILIKLTRRTYFMNTCKNEKGKNTSVFHCLLNKASLSQGRNTIIQVHNTSGLKNMAG